MHGEELQYIQEAFDTNWIAPLGPNVNALEQEVAAYLEKTRRKTEQGIEEDSRAAEEAIAADIYGFIGRNGCHSSGTD